MRLRELIQERINVDYYDNCTGLGIAANVSIGLLLQCAAEILAGCEVSVCVSVCGFS